MNIRWRAAVPLLLGLAIWVFPTPQGLTPNAWAYFALCVTVIAALITEPIPGPVAGLLGITTAAALLLVAPDPTDSIQWALSGFSNGTVWLIFVAHYMFASLTAHATALLPAFLAAAMTVPDMPVRPLALGLCYTIGLMGVLTPYATGPAPIYFGSGYITRGEFWTLGSVFGAIYLLALVAIGVPYLLAVSP